MSKTRDYYEACLGEAGCLRSSKPVQFIYSKERNVVQAGYSRRFDLYIWIEPERLVVSYGDIALDKIDDLKQQLSEELHMDEIKQLLTEIYGTAVKHTLKYEFEQLPENQTNQAYTLSAEDYTDYEQFFRMQHPGAKDISWLPEYFEEMIAEGLCVVFYENEQIVCCTDAPMMPYMAESVQEIGINTLPNHQKKGHAYLVCCQLIKNILLVNKVPQWSTTSDNIGSQKLAQRVGFKKLADVLMVTI